MPGRYDEPIAPAVSYAPGTTPGKVPFDLNPAPQAGQGAYGAVPGPIGLPPVYNDLAGVYPNLSGTNAKVSQNILSELSGQLSPDTVNAIQDQAARFGITSGMPGSDLAGRSGLKNLGLMTEDQINRGLANYNATIPTISRTQTLPPGLQADIASRNALFGSAPNPSLAAAEAERKFRSGLGAGGGGGGISATGHMGPSSALPGTPNTALSGYPAVGATSGSLPSGYSVTPYQSPSNNFNDPFSGQYDFGAGGTNYGGGDIYGSGGFNLENTAYGNDYGNEAISDPNQVGYDIWNDPGFDFGPSDYSAGQGPLDYNDPFAYAGDTGGDLGGDWGY